MDNTKKKLNIRVYVLGCLNRELMEKDYSQIRHDIIPFMLDLFTRDPVWTKEAIIVGFQAATDWLNNDNYRVYSDDE